MRNFLLLISLALLLALTAPQMSAQNYIEIRGAASRMGAYRYIEYNHSFKNKLMVDMLYFGVPGQNELYVGLGYPLKPTKSFTVTPLVYAVVGKENGERGAAVGAFVTGRALGLNVNGFVGHFRPIRGSVPAYTYLDSLDISKSAGKWEFGASAGFFYLAKTWNPLIGPVIVRNDERGAWRLYLRGGANPEARLTRTFNF